MAAVQPYLQAAALAAAESSTASCWPTFFSATQLHWQRPKPSSWCGHSLPPGVGTGGHEMGTCQLQPKMLVEPLPSAPMWWSTVIILARSKKSFFSQVPLKDMCLCLQAAASASASANTDVVAKKADIAVPVIIAKKQGDCHWCRCQWHVHSVAQKELCLTGCLVAHVRGISAERHSCSAALVCDVQDIYAASWAQVLGSCFGVALVVLVAFIDLPANDSCQHAVRLPCRRLLTTSSSATTVSAGFIMGLLGTNSVPRQLFQPYDGFCTSPCFQYVVLGEALQKCAEV